MLAKSLMCCLLEEELPLETVWLMISCFFACCILIVNMRGFDIGNILFSTVIALQRVKESLRNPPLDWSGDPCVPRQYSWTGITCSEGPRIRIVTL